MILRLLVAISPSFIVFTFWQKTSYLKQVRFSWPSELRLLNAVVYPAEWNKWSLATGWAIGLRPRFWLRKQDEKSLSTRNPISDREHLKTTYGRCNASTDWTRKTETRWLCFCPFTPQSTLTKGRKIDSKLQNITVAHLMRHQGGWHRDKSIDPLFHSIEIATSLGKKPPASQDDIIRFMKGWPLDFEPGTRYAYSNLGYCLLGRVIEQTTGQNYETYMRNSFLKPLGITRMRSGKTLQRAEGEVTYYPKGQLVGIAVTGPHIGAKVPRPYGAWHLEAMDSLGGWFIRPRSGSLPVDKFEHSKILKTQTIETMLERPKGHFAMIKRWARQGILRMRLVCSASPQ